MSSSQDVLTLIQAFCSRHLTGQMSLGQLMSFTDRYILENPEKERILEDLLRMNGRNLVSQLETLEHQGDVRLDRTDSAISMITYPSYFLKAIEDGYQRLDDKPELPFPTEDTLRLAIPLEDVRSIEIKSDFFHWLGRSDEGVILRINFPEGVQSLIATSDILSTRMVIAAVQKIRHYLRDSKNLAYMRQRLTPIFRSREITVKEMLQTMITSPEQSAQTIMEPTDFTFQLWTQLSTNLVKEYGGKADKMAEEHAFCQAAYLIGYYNMFFRNKVQKKKEEDSALGFLGQNLRKSPYAYRITEIYEFTDDKGILLTKRCTKERIHEWIQERIKPQNGKDIPDILAFTTHNKEEYYMLYTSAGQYISDNLLKAQKDMREFYKVSWQLALRGDVEFTTMTSDEVFRAHIEQRLRTHFPQLEAVLQFPVVYFASRIDGLPPQVRADLNDTILSAAQKLKPIDQLMKVQRKKILEDAKILLPAWMVIPGISNVVHFLRRLFLGKDMAARNFANGFNHEGQVRLERTSRKAKNEAVEIEDPSKGAGSGGMTRQQQVVAFRQASKLLESEFLAGNELLEPSMNSLVERWNTLLDPRAKSDLLTDVNSLCRDYLRKQKAFAKSYPPSAETLRIYASKLVEGDLLSGIRNKKDLLRYVELYYVWLLENAEK